MAVDAVDRSYDYPHVAALQVDVAAPGVIRRGVMVTSAAHDRQFLLLRSADRDHEPATVRQLTNQQGRYARRARRNDDAALPLCRR